MSHRLIILSLNHFVRQYTSVCSSVRRATDVNTIEDENVEVEESHPGVSTALKIFIT
jgi:hypothetical protein